MPQVHLSVPRRHRELMAGHGVHEGKTLSPSNVYALTSCLGHGHQFDKLGICGIPGRVRRRGDMPCPLGGSTRTGTTFTLLCSSNQQDRFVEPASLTNEHARLSVLSASPAGGAGRPTATWWADTRCKMATGSTTSRPASPCCFMCIVPAQPVRICRTSYWM